MVIPSAHKARAGYVTSEYGVEVRGAHASNTAKRGAASVVAPQRWAPALARSEIVSTGVEEPECGCTIRKRTATRTASRVESLSPPG